MTRFMKRFICLVVFMYIALDAHAMCFEPSEPFGSVPSAPFCAGGLGGVGSCDQWEIDNYKSEIERHIKKYSDYFEEIQEYVECQQKAAVSAWNNFANN